ncbi:Uncharacterized protein dnm_070670 [Desulfonema magnum]|uniref:Uncharacterized protein n=1 Tax=Desulfonema magnum TaxID=45655 RepID=A0A975GSE8_9BACT|nr:Uncharacterized protein dnm_070670 [Desulfonema magnum]
MIKSVDRKVSGLCSGEQRNPAFFPGRSVVPAGKSRVSSPSALSARGSLKTFFDLLKMRYKSEKAFLILGQNRAIFLVFGKNRKTRMIKFSNFFLTESGTKFFLT